MTPDDMIGATVGSYQVTAKLGQGGMGAVYLAEHPLLQRKAAVKVLLPELSQQKELVERFFHEARTTARLRHPAMVDVYDFGTLADGRAFLIMDFLEGECLEDRIRTQGRLALASALRITRDIALGVSVAHAEHIVHRDLKPENIFLLPALAGSVDERVKILDFGIAKLGGKAGEEGVNVTRVGALMGTPLYMSPEQCRGAGEVDSRADIYSLGCILFAMLAGRPPFVSDSMGELLGAQLLVPPPTLESLGVPVPAAIEGFAQKLLAKMPDERPGSMVEVAETLDGLLRQVRSGLFRNAQTLAFGAPERDGNTRRGRPTPDALTPEGGLRFGLEGNAPNKTAKTAEAVLANVAPATPVAPTGRGETLEGRSISAGAQGETKVVRTRRPLLLVGATLAVVLAGGWLLFATLRRPVDVAGGGGSPAVGSTSPRPAVTGAGTSAAAAPAQAPAVEPPAAGATAPASPGTDGIGQAGPAAGATTTSAETPPVPSRAGSIVPGAGDGRSGGRKSIAGSARGRVIPSSGKVSVDPSSSPPEPPPTSPPKGTRPVYRGTQLQIEKNDPY